MSGVVIFAAGDCMSRVKEGRPSLPSWVYLTDRPVVVVHEMREVRGWIEENLDMSRVENIVHLPRGESGRLGALWHLTMRYGMEPPTPFEHPYQELCRWTQAQVPHSVEEALAGCADE